MAICSPVTLPTKTCRIHFKPLTINITDYSRYMAYCCSKNISLDKKLSEQTILLQRISKLMIKLLAHLSNFNQRFLSRFASGVQIAFLTSLRNGVVYVLFSPIWQDVLFFAKEQILRTPGCLYSLFLLSSIKSQSNSTKQNTKQLAKKTGRRNNLPVNLHKRGLIL